MTTTGTVLFEYGVDGGGAKVYRLPDNKVIEKGKSGGIPDDEDDLMRKSEREFDNWHAWWQNFTSKYGEFWICFSPRFIHNDIKSCIQKALKSYFSENPDAAFYKEYWEYALIEKHRCGINNNIG